MQIQLEHLPHDIHKLFAGIYALYTVHSSAFAVVDGSKVFINDRFKTDTKHLAVLDTLFPETEFTVRMFKEKLFEKKVYEIQFKLLN